jgi:hypothetical protein
MPFPGLILKKRLKKYSAFVKDRLKSLKNDSQRDPKMLDASANADREFLQKFDLICKRIPDGFPDHIYCTVSTPYRKMPLLTEEADEENE